MTSFNALPTLTEERALYCPERYNSGKLKCLVDFLFQVIQKYLNIRIILFNPFVIPSKLIIRDVGDHNLLRFDVSIENPSTFTIEQKPVMDEGNVYFLIFQAEPGKISSV